MRVGLVAGEASGDLLGAGLIRALVARVPDLYCEGVAGPAMHEAGCHVLEDAEALAVMGLVEPIREIPRLLRLRRYLLARWMASPPDAVVGIDAPDFNLGLELRLKRAGISTLHYVSPSVWAWRQGRIRKIRQAVDRVLCLLPFEKAFYDQHGVPADFVGHPMAERIRCDLDAEEARRRLGLTGSSIVAVLPGSRGAEIQRLGPPFIGACRLLAAAPATAGVTFVAPMASARLRSLFEQQLKDAGMREQFTVTDGDSETAIAAADVVLLASGTAALEAALLLRPMVAAYRVAPLTYAIARSFRLLKTPHITLPNLLTPTPLVPEFTQQNATPAALAAAVGDLLRDEARREQIAREFSGLREQLRRNADERAADAVLDVIAAAAAR